ncbi:hypothetical protein HAX54_034654 [Datura stramonium]|uniref:Uncharacterized protein n=1 Tax=Datura stramonium TaxID=4076 RepID=A0ABS8VGJ8_DATST|nr:hypothetical protein [Datura stramonium]
METPSQDINNKGDDVQEKPKVENEEGDEKEKIVEKERPQDINKKGDDVQGKSKVEHEEGPNHEYRFDSILCQGGDEKGKIAQKETPSQDIMNKGDDAQEIPKVEYEEEKHEKVRRVIRPGGGRQPALRSAPPGKRDPPRMQTG